MAASAAMIGYGSTVSVETGVGTGVYTALAEINDITPPSQSVDVIDVTNMGSADSTREFIQGLMDPGELSLDMNFIPSSTSDALIRAWRSARELRRIKITFPNAVVWTVYGFITGYTPAVPMADKMTAGLTVKVTSSVSVA